MRKKGFSARKLRWVGLLVLPCASFLLLSLMVLSIETVPVRNLRGDGYEFHDQSNIFENLFAIPKTYGYTDEELLSALNGTSDGSIENPYTDQPMIIEASPGNFTVRRENNKIIDVFLFHRSGAEYRLHE